MSGTESVDEAALFERIAAIIENRKARAASHANAEITLMYWEIGHFINSALLGGERAGYGKRIVTTLSAQLMEQYGSPFAARNLRRMVQFSVRFPVIVSPLATQLSWSHIAKPCWKRCLYNRRRS
jgi:hypothetical protein